MFWPTKKLEDVLDYEQPGKYIVSFKKYSNNFRTPVLTAGKTFILGNTDEKDNIFPTEKLPVIIFDDFTTATQFVDFQFKVKSSAMKILHAKKDQADIKYLFYLMQTLKVNHATHKRFWISEYSKIQIQLPSVAEQRKIVKKIEELFGGIDKAQKLREEAQKDAAVLVPAALHQFLSKAKGWKEETIWNLSLEIKSGFACGQTNAVEKGVVHLRTHNIDLNGEINLSKVIQIPEKFVDRKIYNLKRGDILFNNTNSRELVGKTIIIRENLKYAFSNHLTRVRLNDKLIIPEWLLLIFQKYWRDKIFENMCTKWIGQAGINQTALGNIKIPVPPVSEQKRIVEYLDSLSEKTRNLQELQAGAAGDFKALKQSILHKAFAGELV